MIPNITIATDNIYKFACLFGLAIIVASIFSFVNVYSSTLDKKVQLSETIIRIEAEEKLTKVQEDTLELNKKLLEVAKNNERFAQIVISSIFLFGLILSIYGARRWRMKIQVRDDLLATLQIEKLRAEITKLELETGNLRNSAVGQFEQQDVTAQNDG